MLTASGLTDPLVFIGGLELQVRLGAPVWISCLLPQLERDPPSCDRRTSAASTVDPPNVDRMPSRQQ